MAIDGGGMRGVVSAVVLRRFEKLLQQYSGNPDGRIADFIDLAAGTSAGGILACAYLCPADNGTKYTAEAILELYIKLGKQIFRRSLLRYGLIRSKYSEKPIKKALKAAFGDIRLSEAEKDIIITAYELNNAKSYFFDRAGARRSEMKDYFLRDVAQATSAAPSYFPAPSVTALDGSLHTFIDGGVFANNPSVCAYCEASKLFAKEELLFLSVGNIRSGGIPDCTTVDNGKLQWAIPLFEIMMNGVAQTVDYQLQRLYFKDRSNYLRLDASESEALPCHMDDSDDKCIDYFIKAGEEICCRYDGRLREFAKRATLIKRHAIFR